jgi:hypothetical protein
VMTLTFPLLFLEAGCDSIRSAFIGHRFTQIPQPWQVSWCALIS